MMSFPAKIKKLFLILQEQKELSQNLADNLCDIEYCKGFKLQTEFPVLRHKGMSEFDNTGKNRRYYPFDKFNLRTKNKEYIFTNNWYEKNKSSIQSFFSNYLPEDTVKNVLCNNRTEQIYKHGNRTKKYIRRKIVNKWPEWEVPTLSDIKQIAHLLSPYIKFLHQKIIEKITLSNTELESYFREYLTYSGIDEKYYIWPNCSTMFPGIRRANGKTDNEFKKKQLPKDLRPKKNAIYIDDNSYPKNIWAFIFTGQQFSNKGPNGYELAHIFEHKAVKRVTQELLIHENSSYDLSIPLSGMFTNAAALMYSPRTFVKITDHSLHARRLIQRKVIDLYKNVTNLLPPTVELKEQDEEWDINSFKWGEPVGNLEQIDQFLDSRKERIEKILNLEYPKKSRIG